VFKKTGYSRPHTVHCGPEGIYVSTLGGGGQDGTDGPPGIFIMDCQTFDILGRWEIDRGPQNLHYDFWWNLSSGPCCRGRSAGVYGWHARHASSTLVE
jgi:selenium-binding protein 1